MTTQEPAGLDALFATYRRGGAWEHYPPAPVFEKWRKEAEAALITAIEAPWREALETCETAMDHERDIEVFMAFIQGANPDTGVLDYALGRARALLHPEET